MRFGFQFSDATELKQAMELLPTLGDGAFLELLVGGNPFADTELCEAIGTLDPPIEVLGVQPPKTFAAASATSIETLSGQGALNEKAIFAKRVGAKKIVFCPAVYEIPPKYHDQMAREEQILERAKKLKRWLIGLQTQSGLVLALEHDLRPLRFEDEPGAEDIFHTSRIYTINRFFADDVEGIGICLNSALALGVNNTRDAFAIASKNLAHIRLSDFDVSRDRSQDPPWEIFSTGIFPGRGFRKETWPLTDVLCDAQLFHPDMTITLECSDRSLMQETAEWISYHRQFFEKA